MRKPGISWIPVRLMPAIITDKTMTTEQWLDDARNKFDLTAVEMYHGFLNDLDEAYVDHIATELQRLGLQVSQLCTSTDFTHPDPSARAAQHDYLKRAIVAADKMAAPAIRFVTGQRHPGVTDQQGIDWILSGLEEILKFAEPHGVQIRLENHFRDRSAWELADFAHKAEVFYKLFERVKDTPVMINYDCSNALMCGDDPVEILNVVKDKVASVHASDRKRGSYQHSIIGQGDVPFDEIFAILKESGFSGWISAEDGNPNGDEGFQHSLDFLRSKIDYYWE